MYFSIFSPTFYSLYIISIYLDSCCFLCFQVCVSVRKLISATSEPPDSSKRASYGAAGCGNPKSVRVRGPPTKTITQLNVSYFSKVLDALKKEKREIIQSYGFGSLLLFDKCCIPLPFARWVVDHIQVSSSAIVVNNRSIPLSPHTVHDVLGIPIGGHTIRKGDAENGKGAFLNGMNLTTLPSANFFCDNLSKDNISDDDLVRSFLIIALVTFLCPNSNVHPSTEYLQPLVDVKKAKEWDWSEFVHYWLLKQIKMYNDQMKRLDHASITMGGCLYIVCVSTIFMYIFFEICSSCFILCLFSYINTNFFCATGGLS